MIPIIGSVLEIFNKVIPDPDKQAELKKAMLDQEVQMEKMFSEYAKQDHELRMKELETKGFKAFWRPFIMFSMSTMMLIYMFLYYILPQLVVFFELGNFTLEPVVMPDIVWHVFSYCILGIGGLRTIEKTVRIWKGK